MICMREENTSLLWENKGETENTRAGGKVYREDCSWKVTSAHLWLLVCLLFHRCDAVMFICSPAQMMPWWENTSRFNLSLVVSLLSYCPGLFLWCCCNQAGCCIAGAAECEISFRNLHYLEVCCGSLVLMLLCKLTLCFLETSLIIVLPIPDYWKIFFPIFCSWSIFNCSQMCCHSDVFMEVVETETEGANLKLSSNFKHSQLSI